jgi:spermidine/putrescine transport system substrate-binding protein
LGALLFFAYAPPSLADDNTLNIYVWGGEVPDDVIQSFQDETGIKVNYSTYDNNETLYAKITAVGNPGYDIIEPSSYYVQRMRVAGVLQPLDKSKLINWHYLNPELLNKSYDPGQQYSIPHLWGITGIFVNDKFYDPKSITSWKDLWNPKYKDRLLMLNDLREVFSMSLLTLGNNPNTSDAQQIKTAYLLLKQLSPNVKLYIDDTVISIITDEDATIGMAWNGDAYKAMQDNPHIHFIFPSEGYVLWSDNFAIAKGAPHLDNAYRFLNYIMRPDISAKITMEEGYPTANLAAEALLPPALRNNPVIYPSNAILDKATFESDISNNALALYAHYWELLKLES